jgi:hypothetical protein
MRVVRILLILAFMAGIGWWFWHKQRVLSQRIGFVGCDCYCLWGDW